jgi:outer membrane protein OmpA-like peptidoglycan-associated protein
MRRWYVYVCCAVLSACAGPRERVVLLGAEPGEELTVTTQKGVSVLTLPESSAVISKEGQIALELLPPALIQARYGAVIASTPEPSAQFVFYFGTGKVALDAAGRVTLAQLLVEVQRRGVVEVEITGHTDQVGTEARNDRLSLARAEAVRGLLVAGGLTATFVRAVGRGERQPLLDRPEQAEAKNRRVEVIVR